MKLLLSMFFDRMKEFHPLIRKPKFLSQQFTNVQLLPHSPNRLRTDVVYLTDLHVQKEDVCLIDGVGNGDELCIVFVGAAAGCIEPFCCAVMETETELSIVFNAMHEILESLHRWENAMILSVIRTGDAKALLDISEPVIHEPMALLDPSLKLICSVGDDNNPDPIFRELHDREALTMETVACMVSLGHFPDDDSPAKDRFFEPNSLSPCQQAILPVAVVKGMPRALLYVPFFSHIGMTVGQVELLRQIRDNLSLIFSAENSTDEKVIRREYEYLVLDLLQDKCLDRMEAEARASFLKMELDAPYFLLRMGFPKQSQTPMAYFLARLSDICPWANALVYENCILILLGGPAIAGAPEHHLEDYISSIRPLLTENKLTCGVSQKIDSLMELSSAYHQAVSASVVEQRRIDSSFAKKYQLIPVGIDRQVFRFSRNVSFYMSMCALERMDVKYLCNPRLMELICNTRSAKSNPIRVLYAYLHCNCKLTDTAELLYMHRNSIVYHIRRCEEVLQLDLNDVGAQLDLLQSFEMLILNWSIPGENGDM